MVRHCCRGRTVINQSFQIELLKPNDPKLYNFRAQIYSDDIGIDRKNLDEMLTHSQCKKIFPTYDWEEIYKFGELKWNKTCFDGIAAAIGNNNEVVSMAGFKRYSTFLRVGMHLYTLKKWRSQCRSFLWSDAGFIDRAVEFCDQEKIDGVFLTIHPHNKALSRWAKRLENSQNFGQMATNDPSIKNKMKNFKPLPGLIKFNQVFQKVFLMTTSSSPIAIDSSQKQLKSIIEEI